MTQYPKTCSVCSLITVLIVDISYGIIDPRVRMGGKK